MTPEKEVRKVVHEIHFGVLVGFLFLSLPYLSTKGKEPRIVDWGFVFIFP